MKRHTAGGRRDLDVAGEEVAAVVEAVFCYIGDVGIDDGDCDVALALIVDLNVESGRDLTDAGIDKFTRLYGAVAKSEIDVYDRVEGREDVWNDIHLGDALDEEVALVFAPFLVCEKAVDGFAHVAWIDIISKSDDFVARERERDKTNLDRPQTSS